MPNNLYRLKRGYIPVSGGLTKAKRRDIVGTLRVINRAFVQSGTEQGSPNGTPGPVYSGGGADSGGDYGGGDFSRFGFQPYNP